MQELGGTLTQMAEMIQISDSKRYSIVTDTTSMLAELHWYLRRSSRLMSNERNRVVMEVFSSELKIESREPTDFGQEVGRDEIEWWINRKEQNTPELRDRSEKAMDAAQTLRTKAITLRGCEPASYDDLMAKFKGFVESCRAEVAVLCTSMLSGSTVRACWLRKSFLRIRSGVPLACQIAVRI